MTNTERWYLPTIPLTPIDLINRRAVATGSMSYAMAAIDADYNGHAWTVSYKPNAVSGPLWNAETFFGGRIVVGRGAFETCIQAAKREYDRGSRGTTVAAYVSNEDPKCSPDQQREILSAYGFIRTPDGWKPQDKPDYWTAKHEAVSDAMHARRYDPSLLPVALDFTGDTIEQWQTVRDAHNKARWANR